MIDALLLGLAAALAVLVLHPLVARLLGRPRPDRGLLVGSTSIVFGAVFGAVFFDEQLGIHWGGAFIGGAVGFVLAGIATGLFRR